ncbi:cytochrome b/b6 domain-containing protein [Vibrio hannami]|uniref:cytochrome b/b6 domain-containing protein n=1 Tax=Vibrio hannami TaxID=2717094 RepID=UPI002410A6C1|nr:cytochrome b/b6 domain-containing protein [Vibrio hannami]MDG3088513.1 cytochrome b/b6 domain-containing protein [Vibrio hannami]
MKVWDLPTRLYHWVQLVLFIGLIVSGITEEGPHVIAGLLLFSLLLWRITWGFVGSETSRFSQFLKSPRVVIQYLKGNYPEAPGHNPAGALMVLALVALLLAQCFTGLALAGMLDPLPNSELWLTEELFDVFVLVHENLFKVLIAFSVLHVLAILVYKLKSKPLVKAMFTGIQEGSTFPPVTFASNLLALVILVVTLIISYLFYYYHL